MADVFSQKSMLTRGEKAIAIAKKHLYILTADILSDELLLAEVLAGGRLNWRNTFLREFRGLPVDAECADLLWRLFSQEFKRKFGNVRPRVILDTANVPTPLTEREIEDSWVIENASSDDARRYFGEA